MVERGSRGGVALSVGALRREPGGRAPLLGTLKYMQKGLRGRASLFIGAPFFGEPGGGLDHRGLFGMDEGGSVEEASLSLCPGWLCGGGLEWGSFFTGDPTG